MTAINHTNLNIIRRKEKEEMIKGEREGSMYDSIPFPAVDEVGRF